jgi:hypothetical protein
MVRLLALILLIPISACASGQPVPPVPVGTLTPAPQVEPVEPLDPRIHPLSREEEELAR